MVSHILMGLDAMHPNMHVVSNFLDYDSEGNIVGIKNGDEGIIHVYNKNEKSLEKMDNDNFVASLAARRNVVVLGKIYTRKQFSVGYLIYYARRSRGSLFVSRTNDPQ